MKYISKKKYLFLFVLIVLLLTACGTAKNDDKNGQANTGSITEKPVSEDNPIVTITMDNDKVITVELYPDKAPNTVANFISLVEDGFYDGLIFHRVIPGFMIQGGDPEGTGMGGPGYGIKGEFSSNGFQNDITHERGVISMARTQVPDSAGSQFFIMVEQAPHLDGQYAAFGKVIGGMEAVDEIVSAERDGADKPVKEQKIKKMVVDTKGKDYPDPEVIKFVE